MKRFLGIVSIIAALHLFVVLVIAVEAWAEECMISRELASKGMALYQKDKAKGLAALSQAARLCPGNKSIAYNLGLAYYLRGNKREAYDIWRGLVSAGSRDKKTLANGAWAALELGLADEAVRIADKGLAAHPGDEALMDTKANGLFALRRFRDCYVWVSQMSGGKTSEFRAAAAKYIVDDAWRRFRHGDKKRALSDLITMSGTYPRESAFSEAKDKMVMAMVDDSFVLPPVSQLPDGFSPPPHIEAADDSLDSEIAGLKRISNKEKRRHAYALIVGISDYENINDLPYAVRDAKNIHRLLARRGPFINDTRHILLRLNDDASHTKLYRDIKWLLNRGKLHPDALLLFYFSGHGAPVIRQGGNEVTDGLLLPSDAVAEVLSDRTALSMNWLKDQLAGLKNRDVVCVVDACFTGEGRSVTPFKGAMVEIDESFMKGEKPIIVAAGQRAAREYADGRQGAFTYFFLEGLLGKADGKNGDSDGWVDALEAFKHAKDRLQDMGMDQDPSMHPEVRVRLVKTP